MIRNKLVVVMFILVVAVATPQAGAAPIDDYIVRNGPQICAYLHDNPNLAAVTAIWRQLQRAGFGEREAATVIAQSVERICPEHSALLERYAGRGTRIV